MLKVLFGAALALALLPVAGFASEAGVISADKAPLTLAKRSKPREPGGSGCDDPRDLIEHPECGGLKAGEPDLG